MQKSIKITKQNILRYILYLILIAVSLYYVFPFLWMILSSFKHNADIISIPFNLIPKEWVFTNYWESLTYPNMHFPRYFLNSFIVTVFSIMLSTVLVTTAGYGFAKYKFKGNNALFLLILSNLMIPFQAIMVPLFLLVVNLGLYNTYPGIIIPISLNAFGVFLMRQFFYSVPNEIIESARIDGAGEFRIFLSIGLPLVRTPLMTFIVLHAIGAWNSFLWVLIATTGDNFKTVPLGLALFQSARNQNYSYILAMAVLASIPTLLLYIFATKYFMRGLSTTGIK